MADPPPATTEGSPRELAPATFELKDVSTKYDFRVNLLPGPPAASDESRGPRGEIVIFLKGDVRPLHQIMLEDVGPRAGVEGYEPELSLGDYDFDGEEDFAFWDGDGGPYGSQTYSVFVRRTKGAPFVRSESLSNLTREAMGFFDVDQKKRVLRTSSKSGCCIHWTNEYVIVAGEPQLVRSETQDALNEGCQVTFETRLKDGKWRKQTRPCPPE